MLKKQINKMENIDKNLDKKVDIKEYARLCGLKSAFAIYRRVLAGIPKENPLKAERVQDNNGVWGLVIDTEKYPPVLLKRGRPKFKK
ncbi:MAG: hypothetical protein ACRC37_01635 [Lentisphaeria bacterium]